MITPAEQAAPAVSCAVIPDWPQLPTAEL